MQKTSIMRTLGACIVMGTLTLGGMGSAQGHGKKLDVYTLKRVINVVAQQNMLTYKMCTQALLIALGMDVQEEFGRLRQSRDLFDRNIKGLRHGDSEVGLPITKYESILEKIGLVEQRWSALDAAITNNIVPDAVTAKEIAQLSNLHHRIVPAIDDIKSAYLQERGIGLFSLFMKALATAADQRTLTQKMLNEFALIAYGHNVGHNKVNLTESASEFDMILQGLLVGDTERRLVAAPTSEIRLQLAEIKRIWLEFRPYLTAAGQGAAVDRSTMQEVADLNARLFEETDKVVSLYEAL